MAARLVRHRWCGRRCVAFRRVDGKQPVLSERPVPCLIGRLTPDRVGVRPCRRATQLEPVMNRLSIISGILATTALCFAGTGCSSDTTNNSDAGVSDGSSTTADITIAGEDGTASPDATSRPDGSTVPGDGTTVPDSSGPMVDCGALNRETLGDGSCGGCTSGTDDDCADSPCFEGVECTDEPAPGTGYSCGECPAGTTGDGETCTPVVCTPECAGWQSCVSGTCRARSCSSQGQCPGAVCFEGTCREGSTCPAACSSRYGSGNWECVADGRCRKVDCRNSGECGGGRDCVSDSNTPRGTFDQTCSSSPCGGACASFQICSAERRACAP